MSSSSNERSVDGYDGSQSRKLPSLEIKCLTKKHYNPCCFLVFVLFQPQTSVDTLLRFHVTNQMLAK